ncbi:recombinase family protein [Ihubacter sp. mB4P-1]|uniref:recombinase family protein n=1 Tax=Ihubacter sp. mB4P-1 TaxID=3242370 RepID=UPI003C7AA6CB
MSRITKIEAVKKQPKKKIRVAAYARVSTGSDKQLASLDTQKRHYEQYIKARPDWDYAGLYFDEGVTGTKMAKRDGLLQMLGDCERGLIDYIIVKSISRFSRNTVESIETIRRLSEKGIYIFFEKENIDTGKMESELLLSILSSLAESESRSIAENNKWSVQKRFANGTYKLGYMPYGYKKVDGEMVVDEDEAKIVRQIFANYISGKSTQSIARGLNERGISPKRGNSWSAHVVGGMLKNEKYIGDVLLGKTYTDSQFNRHINHGERDMYYIENHHPAIVSKEDFESANKLLAFNCKEKNIETGSGKCLKRYALSGNVFCGECGSKWKRQMRNGVPCYVCDRHIRDFSSCGQKAVREDFIQAAFMTMMNKLTFAKKEILYLLGKHGGEKSAAVYDRINLLQDELESVIARRESIQTFFAKGFLDPAVYQEELDAVTEEERRIITEKDSLTRGVTNYHDKAVAIAKLIAYAGKGMMLTEFSEEIFSEHIDRVMIISRTEAEFQLKCGLALRERIQE